MSTGPLIRKLLITMQGSSRERFWAGAVSAAVFFAFLLGEVPRAAALDKTVVKFDLNAVSDPEVAKSIEADPNLAQLFESGESRSFLGIETFARQIESQRQRLELLIRSFGYLDARVAVAGDIQNGIVTFEPTLGRLSNLEKISLPDLEVHDFPADVRSDIISNTAPLIGSPATAARIRHIESEILWRIHETVNPKAQLVAEKLDRTIGGNSVDLVLSFAPLQPLKFGAVELTSIGRVAADDVALFQPFRIGEPYSGQKMRVLYDAVLARPDISSFDLRMAEDLDADGNTSVELLVVRRLPSPAELLKQSRFVLALGLLTILLSTGRLAVQSFGCGTKTLRKLDVVIFNLAAITVVVASARALLLLSLR